MWQNNVEEHFKTCERCQNDNESTGKRLGNMINLQEPIRPWEIVHIDLVAGLPPGGDRSYNSCPVIVDRFGKNTVFLPFQKDSTAMDTAHLIWNRVA
ncbi:hypothetical protein O181_059971 [Austropuccinia psidii MF-1]|uniref:Integrase zinc-binding domain-containing protein n=1 Tax=Austropuccinia psidii MF-1 TaxID=1389203 RepID=A0A9Q3HW58_9BASI|nr:hypothetical protein [Austropuccinia psidii MF-1]